jgi:hypothetical protein
MNDTTYTAPRKWTEAIKARHRFSEIEEVRADLIDRTIVGAFVGKDTATESDRLVLEFDDGTTLIIQEEGQAGCFSVSH